jgi:hypothetical protein
MLDIAMKAERQVYMRKGAMLVSANRGMSCLAAPNLIGLRKTYAHF